MLYSLQKKKYITTFHLVLSFKSHNINMMFLLEFDVIFSFQKKGYNLIFPTNMKQIQLISLQIFHAKYTTDQINM